MINVSSTRPEYAPQLATEVTRPDGTRFVSASTDLRAMSRIYRGDEGYSLRLVEGQHERYGFRITENAR
jgi:hypothetical protein